MTTASTTTLRVIGYVRCSTNEQATEGMSLDAQRAKIEAWANAVGAELVDIIEDGGVSGAKPLADRPGGSKIKAILDARRPQADAIVVKSLDRLGRDAAETLALVKQFQKGAVGLVSVVERLDLSTPQGRAMAGVAAVFSELERALIGQRTADALGELRRQGRKFSGTTPFGWDADEDGRLFENETEQETLRRARELRDGGMSFNKIAAALDGEGRKPKKAAAWSAMAVRSVLAASARMAA